MHRPGFNKELEVQTRLNFVLSFIFQGVDLQVVTPFLLGGSLAFGPPFHHSSLGERGRCPFTALVGGACALSRKFSSLFWLGTHATHA